MNTRNELYLVFLLADTEVLVGSDYSSAPVIPSFIWTEKVLADPRLVRERLDECLTSC